MTRLRLGSNPDAWIGTKLVAPRAVRLRIGYNGGVINAMRARLLPRRIALFAY